MFGKIWEVWVWLNLGNYNFRFPPVFGSCNSKMLLVKIWDSLIHFEKFDLLSSKSQERISIITFLFFFFHRMLYATFFVTIALTSKLWNLIDLAIEKLFYFMFLSNWFDWNVKWKIFLLINHSWKKYYFIIFEVRYAAIIFQKYW